MPTTANGTAYTVYSANVSGGGMTYWAVADAHVSDPDLLAVLYTHGASGAANQLATLSNWSTFRDWLIDNGWAWVEGNGGGGQPWGNAASQTAYDASFAHVDGILDISKVVVVGRSMGGAVGARLYLDHRDSDARFVGFISVSGVLDLAWAYDYDSNRWTAAFNTAWGVTNKPDFLTAAAGLNPIDGPAADWDGANVLQIVGTADTTVPGADNGLAMRTMYAGHPAYDVLDSVVGATHGGTYSELTQMTSFLQVVTDVTPPTPPDLTAREISVMYIMHSGGAHTLL